MPVDPRKTISDLQELRALTADDHGAQRIAWTPTWLKARAWFQDKLAKLPVEHHLDAAGNSWTTLPGESEKTLILGSHLDSVPNGGWLDGALGVLAAFEVLRALAEEFHGKPPVTIRLVDWADEEGARFGRSLFGSSAFAGTHSIQADRGRTDRDGIRLEDALRQCQIDIERIGDAAAERGKASAYLELHIEQGPVLEAHGPAAGRRPGHQGRGTPRDHFPRAGGTLRIHPDGGAPGCARRRGQARAGDPADRRQASRRGVHHGQRENLPRHRDRRGRAAAKPPSTSVTSTQTCWRRCWREARAASERFASEEGCTVEWSRIWSIEPIPFHSAIDRTVRAGHSRDLR